MHPAKYSYKLPPELIASKGVEPRDSARLFVYDRASDEVTFDIFRNLHLYLPEKSLLVLNNTKVLPARLNLRKETGGKAEVLFLVNEYDGGYEIKGIADRRLNVDQKLFLQNSEKFFTVTRQKENIFYFRPNFSPSELPDTLFSHGTTPVPRYLGSSGLEEEVLRRRYQSVFAENPASIAAPTASLHFTDDVFECLKEKNIERAFLTLHVGLGTFAPLREENWRLKKLHEEHFEIPASTVVSIRMAKKEGRSITAVGTTTLRTLESAASELLEANSGGSIEGTTDLFIFPPFKFCLAEHLLTNFHLPESSLVCLVDAFLQSKQSKKGVLDLYEIAIKNKFRFYSFGDAMLII